MTIDLTPEQEKIIKDELKSGHFRTAQEVITGALRALREKERSLRETTARVAQREAVREMLEFVDRNRVRLEGVTVKELVHGGHRL